MQSSSHESLSPGQQQQAPGLEDSNQAYCHRQLPSYLALRCMQHMDPQCRLCKQVLSEYMVKNKGIIPGSYHDIVTQRKELRDIVFSMWPACTQPDPEHPDRPFRVQPEPQMLVSKLTPDNSGIVPAVDLLTSSSLGDAATCILCSVCTPPEPHRLSSIPHGYGGLLVQLLHAPAVASGFVL